MWGTLDGPTCCTSLLFQCTSQSSRAAARSSTAGDSGSRALQKCAVVVLTLALGPCRTAPQQQWLWGCAELHCSSIGFGAMLHSPGVAGAGPCCTQTHYRSRMQSWSVQPMDWPHATHLSHGADEFDTSALTIQSVSLQIKKKKKDWCAETSVYL